MEPFIYFIKYLINFELKFSFIAICNNKAIILLLMDDNILLINVYIAISVELLHQRKYK